MQDLPFKTGEKIVAIGDRIMESDQADPPPGSGWVRRLRDLLIAAAPDRHIDVIDTTSDVQRLHLVRQRWCDDVLWHEPDWILLNVGVSDIYHHMEAKPEHMAPDVFGRVLEQLVGWTRERLPRVRFVLIDPVFATLDDDPAWGTGQFRKHLPAYRAELRRVAETCDCLYASVQDAIEQRLAAAGEAVFGPDFANPDQDGAILIADHVLRACGATVPAAPPVAAGETVVFIGDSITDAGRRQPSLRPYGTGFMRLWRGLLLAREPELGASLRIENRGVGGHTILNLRHRWQRDCLDLEPDHVVMKIGINDINRWLSKGPDPVDAELYGRIADELLGTLREARPHCGITLLSPFYMSTDTHPDSYRRQVLEAFPAYIAKGRETAAQWEGSFVDLHAVFADHLVHRSTRVFGGGRGQDVVHPSETGCMVIAEALYRGMSS